MKAVKSYLVLNTPAPATSENRFVLVTVNPIELLATCVVSKLKVNELRNLNCTCRDLFQLDRVMDHWFLLLFVYVEQIISKKLWIVRMLLANNMVNCNNYESSWTMQIIWIAIVSNRRSDVKSCKQSCEPGCFINLAIASENKIDDLFSIIW